MIYFIIMHVVSSSFLWSINNQSENGGFVKIRNNSRNTYKAEDSAESSFIWKNMIISSADRNY